LVLPSSQHQPPSNDPAEAAGSSEAAIRRTLAEDPLFVFFQNWWRHLLTAVVLVFAVLYARDAFESTRQESLQRASDVFENLRLEYEVLTEPGLEIDEARRSRFFSYVEALKSERAPYKDMAGLYAGLLHLHFQDLESSQQYLSLDSWDGISSRDHSARLVGELGALALSRAMLDQSDEQGVARARASLESLARNGVFSNVSAALTLYRIAKDSAEAQQARAIIEEIQFNQPEQSELIRAELAAIGG